MVRQIPINPKKVYGKFEPPEENTDITADPIDSPPEKTYKKDLPKGRATFEQPQKDTRAINISAIWLSVAFLIGAIFISNAIPTFFSFKAAPALGSFVQIALATASLIFNMQNSGLQAKTFPRLGINPLHIITIIDLILIFLGIVDLFGHLFNGFFGF